MYLHSNYKSIISSEYYAAQKRRYVKYVDDEHVQKVALFVINASIGAIKRDLTPRIKITQMLWRKFPNNPRASKKLLLGEDIVSLGVELMMNKAAFKL